MTFPDVDRGLSPLPCPFCGSGDVSVTDATRILGAWNLIHRCKVVGAISLQEATCEKVVTSWNTRRALEAPRPSDDEGVRVVDAKASAINLIREVVRERAEAPDAHHEWDADEVLAELQEALPRMTAPVERDLAARRMGEGGCADAQERPSEEQIEAACRRMIAVSRPGSHPDDLTPGPRGSMGLMPKWELFRHLAEAVLGEPLPAAPEAGQ